MDWDEQSEQSTDEQSVPTKFTQNPALQVFRKTYDQR